MPVAAIAGVANLAFEPYPTKTFVPAPMIGSDPIFCGESPSCFMANSVAGTTASRSFSDVVQPKFYESRLRLQPIGNKKGSVGSRLNSIIGYADAKAEKANGKNWHANAFTCVL